jgi:hypothetical protein
LRLMTIRKTLKTSFMLIAISALSISTSLSTLKIRGHLTNNVTQASMRTTRSMWCYRLLDSLCSLSSDAIVSRPSRMTTIMQMSSTRYLFVPHEFVKVALWHFISNVLNMYQPCFDRFWSVEEIDEIKVEQHYLIKRYIND